MTMLNRMLDKRVEQNQPARPGLSDLTSTSGGPSSFALGTQLATIQQALPLCVTPAAH